nr:unnamed protein product [Callosobruchus analis]
MEKFVNKQKKKPAVRPDSSQPSTIKVDETEEDVVHESHYDSDSGKSSTTLKKKLSGRHEDFRKWIKPSFHGIHHFKCKICNKDYIGGVAAVKKHSLSKKHSNNMNALRGQSTLSKKYLPFSRIK